MAKANPRPGTPAASPQIDYRSVPLLFEDTGELEHVTWSLDERRLLAKAPPSKMRDAAFSNGPLPELAKRLRCALTFTGIAEQDLQDANEVRWLLRSPNSLNNLQEACAEALLVVLAIASPEDLDERMEEIKQKIERANYIISDTRRQERESADFHGASKARTKRLELVAARRCAIEGIARKNGWNQGVFLDSVAWRKVVRELRKAAAYEDKKKTSDRTLNQDALELGIKRRRKSRKK